MDTLASLNHPVWDCKYRVVFIPKCQCCTLYWDLRTWAQVFRQLTAQKESRIEEDHFAAARSRLVEDELARES